MTVRLRYRGLREPALLLGGMALFGSATPVSKIVGETFAPMLAGFLRVAIGSALLLVAARGHWPAIARIGRGDWVRIGMIALFGMFGFSAFMLYGMRFASGVVGATIMAMTPAVTAGGAMLFMGERPSWRKLAALVLALAGALVLALGNHLASENGRPVLIGAVLVFAAICCEAVYTLVGQQVAKTIEPVLSAALAAAISVPLFVIGVAVTRQWSLPQAEGRAWAVLGFYAAGTLALGSWLWYRGIARVSGVTAAAFMGVMPLSALVLSYILLREPFHWIHLVGFVTVFVGVALMSWEHAQHDDG